MESQTIRMERCPRCGGLVVKGRSCDRCAGVPDDPASIGPGAGVPITPVGAGSDLGAASPPASSFGASPLYEDTPPPAHPGGWVTGGPHQAAAGGRRRTSTLLLVLVGLVIVLLLVALGVSSFFGGGTDPLISGWHRLEGRGVSLEVPQSFVGGDPASASEAIGEQLRAVGGDWQTMAQWIEQNRDFVLLVATDSQSATAGFATNVNVVVETVPSSMTVEGYLAAARNQLPPPFELLESSLVTVGQEGVGRAVVGFEINGVPGMQAAYALKRGDRMYVVTYTTSADEWDGRSQSFEQSVGTFRD